MIPRISDSSLTAVARSVSLLCFETRIYSSAKRTMCSSKVELNINTKPILRYIHVFYTSERERNRGRQVFSIIILIKKKLTTFVQLNGNMSAICEISRNNMRQVIRREKRAQNTIKRMRPINGSRNRPTCNVPAEHSQARQAADDNYTYIHTIKDNNIKDIIIKVK